MRGAELVSIAQASAATGIGTETLRMWERRYGRPTPVRRPSGHRRYRPEQIAWLRLVAEAISRGHRPARALRWSEQELADRLPSAFRESGAAKSVERLVDLVCRFDERRIVTLLRAEAARLGHLPFLSQCLAPFLRVVGEGWRNDALEIRHEHFISQLLEGLLRELRCELNVKKSAPLFLLTTLCGERHGLGLQMASLVAAQSGVRVCTLGTETPNREMARAVVEMRPAVVGVSISLATCGVETERTLAQLREELPAVVKLVAGGQGARRLRRGVRGVEYFATLENFAAWLARNAHPTARAS